LICAAHVAEWAALRLVGLVNRPPLRAFGGGQALEDLSFAEGLPRRRVTMNAASCSLNIEVM